jgi:F-type H+-transporting ATPase subunit b
MGAIGINWQYLLAQLINFGILFALLSVFLYKPMRRKLDERSAKIKESMEQAEQIKQQLANTEQMVK